MLPVITQAELNIEPIEWLGLHRKYQNAGELEILVALARSIDAHSMLEIGCRDGRTAKLMLHNVPSLQRYIGVDVESGYQPEHAHQLDEIPKIPGQYANGDPRFELILRPNGSFDLLDDDLQSCDIVYIDGDHGRWAVRHDSILAFQIVRKDGLIVWHDYNNAMTVDVKTVLDDFAKYGFPIKLIEGTWFACMRQIKKPGGNWVP
jgi:predicted O-methyltransferase YrrM